MLTMILRLALSGLRKRALAASLTVLLVTAGAGTLTLALHLRSVADDPWDRTFRETNGAHVLLFGQSRDIARAAELPAVAASALAPTVVTSFRHEGKRFALRAAGIGTEPAAVERPVVTEGRWLAGPRELLLERSFARKLGLRPGDTLPVKTTRGWRNFSIVGTAVLASGEPYPESQPGLAFLAREGVALIQPSESGLTWTLAVRLDDPSAPAAFVRQAGALFEPGTVFFEDWLDMRFDAGERHRTTTIVLSTFSVVVLLAVGFVLAVVVGGRVLERYQEIGLLKSIGFTPAQVSLLFLVEQLALGLVGSIAGVVVGVLVTPLVARRSAEVLGGAPVELELTQLVLVVLIIEALVAVVALIPSLRGARFTVLHALGVARGGRRLSRPARLLRLFTPLPLSLGLKDALARPGRTVATTLALALTVGSLVAGLAMETTLRNEDAFETAQAAAMTAPPDPAGLAPRRPDPVPAEDATREQVRPLVHGLNAALLLVAIANLLVTALLAVRERVRDLGVLKAIGLTPAQVRRSVFATHSVLGVGAAVIGIPLGLGLFVGVYQIANGDTELVKLPAWWVLMLVPAASALAVALVSALPARRAASLNVIEALHYE